MTTQSKKPTLERVPRADKLSLLRDILHVLNELGGASGIRRLFHETTRTVTKPRLDSWVASTFEDYLATGQVLTLIKTTGRAAKITEKGSEFVEVSKFGEIDLGIPEKGFLKALLLGFPPFQAFLSIGFCQGQEFTDENQMYIGHECPDRKKLLKAYMQAKGHDTDREARTLLGWSEQIGLVEFDGYSKQYHLVKEQSIDRNSFLKELKGTYKDTLDQRSKVALIPELRARFCCSTHMSRDSFDRYLLELNEMMPSEVQLGKASRSRSRVRQFGIHGKVFYYYYIKLADELA